MHSNHPHDENSAHHTNTPNAHTTPEPKPTDKSPNTQNWVDWMTWWLWRGPYTRSHPELGREMPQRPWYCASRHGRVGRRQVFQSTQQNIPPHTKHQQHNTHQITPTNAGWSSPVARQAHNLKVIGSNPIPATKSAEPHEEIPSMGFSSLQNSVISTLVANHNGAFNDAPIQSGFHTKTPPGPRQAWWLA